MMLTIDQMFECALELNSVESTGLNFKALWKLISIPAALGIERPACRSNRDKQMYCATLRRAIYAKILKIETRVEFECRSYEARVFRAAAQELLKHGKIAPVRRRTVMELLGIYPNERKWRDELRFSFCLTLVEVMFGFDSNEPAEVA